MIPSLNGEDVLIWMCREMNPYLRDIEAYRHNEREQPGRIFVEQVEKVFGTVEEHACRRILLVCEKGSRYAAFVKDAFRKRPQPKTQRATCELVTEGELAALLQTATNNAIYVVPDRMALPPSLNDLPKYFFDYNEMCPWPAKRSVDDLNREPAEWTRYFLPGSHALAFQLENVRTILKHRNESGIPQYVLITGETGTGKSFFTRNLPRICDKRYDDRHVAFQETASDERADRTCSYLQGNCASLPPELADALLFGAVDGAYTGRVGNVDGLIEGAGDGILFLDEVGDLPLETQGKLLTALEEKAYYRLGDTGKNRKVREVKCRIVFGTNRNLAADAQAWEESRGRTGFRKDLLYRINSCHVELSPLRERLSDKNTAQREVLLNEIVKRYCEGIGLALTDGARREFDDFACRYGWPGNFRDVKHLFEGLKIKALEEETGTVISAYAMKKAVERLSDAKAADVNGANGADGHDMPLIEQVKARFPSPCDAHAIDFIFRVCKDARSCADAGRAYYGSDRKRNFADTFGKRLAHFGLVFDKSVPGHLSHRPATDRPE